MTSEDDLHFGVGDDADGCTPVAYTATFTFHGVAKVATPLLVPALGSQVDDAQATLRDALKRLPTG